jgi:alpha-galactosidase
VAIHYDETRHLFRIESGRMTYAFAVSPTGKLCHLYLGGTLPGEYDLNPELDRIKEPFFSRGVSEEWPWFQEYAVQEPFDYLQPALFCVYEDGTRGIRLYYQSHVQTDTQLDVTLTEPSRAVSVILHYRLCEVPGLLFRSVTVTNGSDRLVQLERFLSATLSLPVGAWNATYFTGHWGAEYIKNRTKITQTCLTLSNTRGTCASHQAIPFVALDTHADEEHGEVIFAGLAWSGDFRMDMEKNFAGNVRLSAGLSDFDTVFTLAPGCSETSPELLIGYTPDGFGDMSRMLYDWEFDVVCPQNKIARPFPVIYNSWYPFEFGVTQYNCMAMLQRAKEVGAELFVIDDGWMKGRTCDRVGLGDWFADPARFPGGLKPIADACHEVGLLFGLWVEPEMLNRNSDLYRLHPDWVLRDPYQSEDLMRNQLVLDLSREDVTQWCIAMLVRLLGECELDYLKWDMNRYLSSFGTNREIRVRYIQNLYKIWQFMNEHYPDVLYENCASGGGRADFGMLPYADRINRSDNADPVDVMRLHEGFTTLFLPKLAGGAGNISPSPNGINNRSTPFSFRAISGMTGSMSIGIDLTTCSDEALREIRNATDIFKTLREDLQNSYVLRLKSVTDGNVSVLEYLRRDGGTVIVFAFGHGLRHAEGNLIIRLRGLDERAAYRDENARPHSGAALMRRGIRIALKGDYAAQYFIFRREDKII